LQSKFKNLMSRFSNKQKLSALKLVPDNEKKEPSKRILVIGSRKHSDVKCVSWFDENLPNVADFDIVIVNTSSLTNELNKIPGTSNNDGWEKLKKNTWIIKKGLLKLLDSGGEIYVIGMSEIRVNFGKGRYFDTQMTNYWWLPLPLEITSEEGESLTIKSSKYNRYLGKVKHWNCFVQFSREEQSIEWLSNFYNHKFAISSLEIPIALNRYNKHIAAELRYQLHDVKEDLSGYISKFKTVETPVKISGPLIFLPLPTEISDHDSINIILEDFFNIIQKTQPPEWVEALSIPKVENFKKEIETRELEIRKIELEITEYKTKIEDVKSYTQLTYETGTPLEEICKSVIIELGGTILPSEISEEEFIVEFEGQRAVVEIKGNTGSIKLTDLRQLGDYLTSYEIANNGARIKGFLIGNSNRLLPLEERESKVDPANVINFATIRGISLVNTAELYRAYLAMLEGKTTGQHILKQMFSKTGVISFQY